MKKYEITHADWPADYPYTPEASAELEFEKDCIHIHYKVTEDQLVANVGEDLGHVWEDSCVEFFVSPLADGYYYNIECNCVGKIYMAYGKDRFERELAPASALSSIIRETTLGTSAFGEREGECSWEIDLKVPYSALFKHDIKSFEGLAPSGNFYKCGGTGKWTHFVSWAPIDTPAPDFHRPEFFESL